MTYNLRALHTRSKSSISYAITLVRHFSAFHSALALKGYVRSGFVVAELPDEYQHVVFELQKFKSILDQVEQLEPEVGTNNTDSRTILYELVGRSQTILQSFLTSIDKFQTSLGEQSIKHKQRFTSDWRKAQWALFMSREVGRVRGELNSCALLIILQLQLLSQ
jgi:hypothetical protein